MREQNKGIRRLFMTLLAVGLSATVLGSGCGTNTSPQGPSVDQLTAWARALDAAGLRLDTAVADYRAVVVSVGEAAMKNRKDLKAWDKEWKKRQKAYDTRVAEVEAHNAAERQKAAAAAAQGAWLNGLAHALDKINLHPAPVPVFPLVPPDPSGAGRRRQPVDDLPGAESAQITGVLSYQPQYLPMPGKPAYPTKVKVRLKDELRSLRRTAGDVAILRSTLATLEVGEAFQPSLDQISQAVAALDERIARATKALRKAVKRDKKRGAVIVTKKAARVAIGSLAADVATARDALEEAVEAAGLDVVLAWPPGKMGPSSVTASGASPTPADRAASPSVSP
jgi:hypothetical protein